MYVLFYKKQVVPQEVDNTLSNAKISERNETLPSPTDFPKDPDNESVSSSDVGSFIIYDSFTDLEGGTEDILEVDTTSHQSLMQT